MPRPRDPLAVCLGSEPVRVDGEPRGRVTSGGYGHRVQRSIAHGDWVGVAVAREPLYDPSGERISPRAGDSRA